MGMMRGIGRWRMGGGIGERDRETGEDAEGGGDGEMGMRGTGRWG